MTVRYVSYDIRKNGDYDDLFAFVKKHKGQAISESLIRFDSDLDLEDFRTELRKAVQGDSSVFILVRTKEGIGHGRAIRR